MIDIAGNYVIRYFFAAAGTAVVLPAIEKIGVGWFSTISTGFLIVATMSLYATAKWGRTWAERTDAIKKARQDSKLESSNASGQDSAQKVYPSKKEETVHEAAPAPETET